MFSWVEAEEDFCFFHLSKRKKQWPTSPFFSLDAQNNSDNGRRLCHPDRWLCPLPAAHLSRPGTHRGQPIAHTPIPAAGRPSLTSRYPLRRADHRSRMGTLHGQPIAHAREDAQAPGPEGSSHMPRKGGRPRGTPQRVSSHMEKTLTHLLCKTLRQELQNWVKRQNKQRRGWKRCLAPFPLLLNIHPVFLPGLRSG